MKAVLPRARLRGCCLTPLAVALATVFALAAPAAMAANVWTVSSPNCVDASQGSGYTGSLRYAALKASTGDTVNVTCSSITLTTGEIIIPQANLTINGPPGSIAGVRANYTSRIFDHQGTGTLSLNSLELVEGFVVGDAGNVRGGCIYSKGNVSLGGTFVAICQARTSTGDASGGGVFATGNLTLESSRLEGNKTYAMSASGTASAGGAYAGGDFVSTDSTISSNKAFVVPSTTSGSGGGLLLAGNVDITGSTISGNETTGSAGGIDIFSVDPASVATSITNSTISGNEAANFVGGLYVNSGTVSLSHSTIAFNFAENAVLSRSPLTKYGPGMAVGAKFGSVAVTLQSSLLSNNTYGSTSPADLDLTVANTAAHTITFNAGPAHNLVRVTFAGVPADTIQNGCPLLGPLRDNGGLTQTHALLSTSPAIDQGDNPGDLAWDQRGSPYARVSGSAADIGAYEVQQVDIIFNNGFDGCQ